MKTLSRWLVLAAVGALLAPSAANAQFFGGSYGSPYGWGGYGSPYGFGGGWGGWGRGFPYGGWGGYGSPYGWGGGLGGSWGYPGYVTAPQVYPTIYTVTTPGNAPRERPTVWPAVAYRDSPVEGGKASIEVRVPVESAEVSIDGVAMKQGGTDRRYITPALTPGSTYGFDIRASWRDAAGKDVSRTQHIDFRAGESRVVDFVSPK
jgi:uncharacterized protein (TIGR03000 family)